MGLPLTKSQFEDKVALVPFSTCHYWNGQANDQGYGLHNKTRAHRISYELHKGPIPDVIDGERVVVRHKCDTPLCVNPDHLELGTQRQNMRDAAERNRMPKGDKNKKTRLSEAQVQEVVSRLDAGEMPSPIAKDYGVAVSLISSIRFGRQRVMVSQKPTGRADRKISDDAAADIFQRMTSGESPSEIAADYGVKNSFVHDIKRGATYASVSGFRKAL